MGVSEKDLVAAGNAMLLKKYAVLVDAHTLISLGIADGNYQSRDKLARMQGASSIMDIEELVGDRKNYGADGKFSVAKAQANMLSIKEASPEDLRNFVEFLGQMQDSIRGIINSTEQDREK